MTKHNLGLEALILIPRLEGCLYPISQTADQINAILDLDPTLAPELDAVRAGLADATAALQRAVEFVTTRYEVAA